MTTEHKQHVLSGRQIQQATGIIAIAFILSAVLGVVRQAIITGSFGAGLELDAFYAAYRVPEMLFTLVAGGALGSAFIPIFGRYLSKDDATSAWRLASAVMTLVTVASVLLGIVAGILAPWITATILVPDAAPVQQALTARLMQIMLATVVVFGISGLIMGVLNTFQHFLMPAIAPSMSNLGLIIGALFLTPYFGIFGLAYGAVLGAVLHLGVQIPAMIRIKPQLTPRFDLHTPGTGEVLKLMGPRMLGSAVVQINFVVNTALASGMATGSLTALTVAFTLMFTVLGVLGQSVGTAVFPSLAALRAQEDFAGFRRTLAEALRGVIFMSMPATIGLIILAAPLVAAISQHGRWTADDTMAAAWALRFFALGLVGFALQEVLARAFYALYDTITPVTIAVGGMLLNVILSLTLIHVVQGTPVPFGPMQNPLQSLSLWVPAAGQGPFGGLALANSLATMIESAVLWLILRRKLQGMHDRHVLSAGFRALIASLVMGAVVFIVAQWLDNRSVYVVLVVGALVGIVTFELLALAFRLPEARSIPETVLRRIRRD